MLQVNANKSYVYLKKDFGISPEEFKKQCDGATYSLGGKDTQLKFDGKLDQEVFERTDASEQAHIFTDITKLAPSLGKIKDAMAAIDKEGIAHVDMGNGDDWSGVKKKSNPKAHSKFEYVFTGDTGAQEIIFTDDNRVKMRTQADHGSIQHEVVGKPYFAADSGGKRDHDSIFYLSESVRVK